MLLIYYRQVKREIENFNTLHDGRVRAYMEFVREDSFAAYLLERVGA